MICAFWSKASAVNENELLANIRQACAAMGILVYHTHRSERSEPGFPDLVLIGSHGVHFRELKTDKGKLTSYQQHWMTSLLTVGVDAGVWRCEQWPDQIMRELKLMGANQVRRPDPTVAEVRAKLNRRRAQ